jgi:putative AdoMet-dependent methyltransferase
MKSCEVTMNKGEKYDQMIKNPKNDALGFFEDYYENMKFIQEHIVTIDPKQVYDIGCGTGNLTGPLSDKIGVIGIDKSNEMLLQANAKYPNMTFINEDIDHWISEADLSSDNLIISSFVLHALQEKEYLFKWFSEVIKNNNTVIIVDYLFKNETERLDFIKSLKNDGKSELCALIESKYYIMIDEIEAWCNTQNLKFKLTMLTHWIGMFEIWI